MSKIIRVLDMNIKPKDIYMVEYDGLGAIFDIYLKYGKPFKVHCADTKDACEEVDRIIEAWENVD